MHPLGGGPGFHCGGFHGTPRFSGCGHHASHHHQLPPLTPPPPPPTPLSRLLRNFNNAPPPPAAGSPTDAASAPQLTPRIRLPLPMLPVDLGIDLASVRGEIENCKRRFEREVWGVICAKALQAGGADAGGSSWKKQQQRGGGATAAEDEDSAATAVGAGSAKRAPQAGGTRGGGGNRTAAPSAGQRPPSEGDPTEDEPAEGGESTEEGNVNNRLSRTSRRIPPMHLQALHHQRRQQQSTGQHQNRHQPRSDDRGVWRDDWFNWNNSSGSTVIGQPHQKPRTATSVAANNSTDAASAPPDCLRRRRAPQRNRLPFSLLPDSCSTTTSYEPVDDEMDDKIIKIDEWLECSGSATNGNNRQGCRRRHRRQKPGAGHADNQEDEVDDDRRTFGSSSTQCGSHRAFVPMVYCNWTGASTNLKAEQPRRQPQHQQQQQQSSAALCLTARLDRNSAS